MSDAADAATLAMRTHAAGVLIMLCAAIDSVQRAAGAHPGAPAGQPWSLHTVTAAATRLLRRWWRALLSLWSARGRENKQGPPVARLQFAAMRVSTMFGLEHIVSAMDAALVAQARTGEAEGPQREAAASTRDMDGGGAARLSEAQREALMSGASRCGRDAAAFLGHPSHIPVRKDELAVVVFATQVLCLRLLQSIVCLLVPARQGHATLLDAAFMKHRGALQSLAAAVGTTPNALAAYGQVVVADNGLALAPSPTCSAAVAEGSGPLLVPNFLRVLARIRLLVVLVCIAGALGWGVAGPGGALSGVALLASPLLLAIST